MLCTGTMSMASRERSILARRLAAARKRAGLKQRQVAAILKVSHGAIGNYEAGTSQPDWQMLSKLADLYGVSVDYLVGRTDDPGPATAGSAEVIAAHANPPPAGKDPEEWMREAQQRFEEFMGAIRREWEAELRRRRNESSSRQ